MRRVSFILVQEQHELARSALRDAWGNRILYREPGHIHTRGWDLYSVGPNGIDEFGWGDDILEGEDVADVMSRH
jgi:hypothetical protein